MPANLEKIGVFVNASFEELTAAIEECGLNAVQIHASREAGFEARLRERFSREQLRILKVIHFRNDLAAELRAAEANDAFDAVLIDSHTATLPGGTGLRFDWKAARGSFVGWRLRLIAAGGLSPDNVSEAISTLQPWGVDVVTGVEALPGKKDAAKVRAFVENARIAAHKMKLDAPVDV